MGRRVGSAGPARRHCSLWHGWPEKPANYLGATGLPRFSPKGWDKIAQGTALGITARDGRGAL